MITTIQLAITVALLVAQVTNNSS